MTDDHFDTVNSKALYTTREDALNAPGEIYNHFKGGVYRKRGEFVWQDGEFAPKQGDVIVAYEHIFPHEHSFYARHKNDFEQVVVKDEYQGRRFSYHNNQQSYLQTEQFDCECASPDHSFKFALELDPVYPYVYMTPYITTYNSFFQRVWEALKYVFGNKRGMGKYDEVILKEKDVIRLQNFANLAVAKLARSQ